MTAFSVPAFTVDHDSRWVDVDLHGNLDQWAQRAAASLEPMMDLAKHAQATATLRSAGEIVRRAGNAFMALILYPGQRVEAIVSFFAIELAGRRGEEAWSRLLADLAAGQPADVSEIATKAGPCRRFLRPYAPGEPGSGEMGQQVAYVWLFLQFDAGVVMTTTFLSMAEADRWRPALDELAAAVELEQTPASDLDGDHAPAAWPEQTAGTRPGQGMIEIRPAQPPGHLQPADNAVLRKWLLRADPVTGTLEFTEDRAFIITPSRSQTFPLPSTGDPGAVHAVCLASYRWIRNLQTGVTWLPLFLDAGGRVLGRGRTRSQPRAGQTWPRRIFNPLLPLGIAVREEFYNTERQFKQAYPST